MGPFGVDARTLWLACLVSLVAPNAVQTQQIAVQRSADETRTYTVFLLGNTGVGQPDELSETLALLKARMALAGENSLVAFLGDMIPCCGFPPVGTPAREEAERFLAPLIEAVSDHPGRVLFVPGEHETNGTDQSESLSRLEEFVEGALGRGNTFVPDGGFPGPQRIEVADGIQVLALNTSWLLAVDPEATGDTGDFQANSDIDVYAELEDVVLRRATDDLIVLGHHPLYSNGRFGGRYPASTHLFPLTLAWEKAFLPLPGIGTAVVAARRALGNPQYFSHERNQWMRENLDRILVEHEDFIYASAHDRSLQLFESGALADMQKYVVSGSAQVSEYVSGSSAHEDVEFVAARTGFVAIHYYADESVWIEFWSPEEDVGAEMIYEAAIREPQRVTVDATPVRGGVSYADSSRVIAAEPGYAASWFHKFLAGSNHREAWTTPVRVPFLDMGQEHGGLTPIKRGGGMQTTSIRLRGGDGRQYVLRSVNKDGQRYLPKEVQNTFVAPISQDFLSYSHPYAAFIVPTLAEALGVYHTNPQLVWVPSDPRLGVYQEVVGNTLMLFEERPNGDMADDPSFGSSEDVVGAPEAYLHITRDNDNRVDQRGLARARLLDMWLSDWDRHVDQWRWSSFDDPDGDGKIYRPIPRDRDQAFNRLNFVLNPLIKPFLNFQDFRESYGSLIGLTTNGHNQDHRFLNELSEDDWIMIADSMRAELSDSVIESAFSGWPEPISELHGARMAAIGKVRRDKLTDVAKAFYRLHARSIDVPGSNKHERFVVERLNDEETEIRVYKTTREGEVGQLLYHRVARRDETDEIVLYGLGGNDQFVVTGDVGRGIQIHAVGGAGEDTYIDRSSVRGRSRARFYDSPDNEVDPEGSATLSSDPFDNAYTQFFEMPRVLPIGAIWYTSDDGLVLFGGVSRSTHSFKKEPFAQSHLLTGSVGTATGAVRIGYSGTYQDVAGDWELGLAADFASQHNFRNFFGLGNETAGGGPEGSERLMLSVGRVSAPIALESRAGWRFEIGPTGVMTNLRDDQTIPDRPHQPGLSPLTLVPQAYVGLRSALELWYRDDSSNPREGYDWQTSVSGNAGVRNAPDDFVQLASSLAFFTSLPTTRQVTLGVRAGGAHNFGTFPFWASNAIGGVANLRGYSSTRYSGRTSAYFNSELRVSLFSVGGEVLPGTWGAIGFVDRGRVWTDGESSSTWHSGYGGGIWYDIVSELTVRLTMGKSPEGTSLLFGTGFLF